MDALRYRHNTDGRLLNLMYILVRDRIYVYQGINLLSILIEWCLIVQDSNNYQRYRNLKGKCLKHLDLML